MKRPHSFRLLSALIVSLGVMATACDATTPAEPGEQPRLGSVSQATYGGDLLKQVGTPIATGSTSGFGKTNEVTPSCDPSGSHSAPDVSYVWTVPFTDTFTIDTFGSSFDTVLVVRYYQGSAPLDCNDNASGSTSQSKLTLNLTAGTTYLITVDGVGAAVGSFKLNIDSVNCPGCPPPQNGCYGSVTSCDTTNHICLPTYNPSGTACTDNNACTTNDSCNGSGGCSGTPVTCNTPPSSCHVAVGSCDSLTGQCVYALKSAGSSCNDGNACTTGDVCNSSGTCSGTSVTCNSPPGQCYNSAGTCNPSTGACSYSPKTSGTACSDGNACTLNDTCNGAGSCSAGTPKSCNSPPGQCYNSTGTCNTSTGACSYAPKSSSATCNDGLACTTNDRCDGYGGCEGFENCGIRACSIGFCNEQGTCEYEYMCMEGEYCSGGYCH